MLAAAFCFLPVLSCKMAIQQVQEMRHGVLEQVVFVRPHG